MVDHNPEAEYYTNTDEVLSEDDIIEADVKVLGWNKKFRIRALTFEQMEDVNFNAADKETGKLDPKLFVYWTIVFGVVRPKFKLEQAKKLAHNNGTFVRELSDEIWNLGRISKTAFDSYILALKNADILKDE